MSGRRQHVALLILLAALMLFAGRSQPGAMSWSAPDPGRLAWAVAALLGYLLACAWLLRRHRPLPTEPAAAGLTVVHASQTGFAEQLARYSAEALQAAGLPARTLPLAELDAAALAGAQRLLFVVSTTGEGDAPDGALRFLRQVMARPPALGSLRYGLLALGDSSYARYCAFGRRLDDWLRQQGAQALFDRVEVDDADPGALRHWQHQLGQLAGGATLPDWAPPDYGRWRLVQRRLLNPGSVGGPVWLLALEALEGQPDWQAGDIAEIGPRQSPAAVAALLAQFGWDGDRELEFDGRRQRLRDLLARRQPPPPERLAAQSGLTPEQALADWPLLPHREYSIASLPTDGQLELLVRQMQRPDGEPGLGSGWLCLHAPLGGEIALRVRRNPGFHPPADARPLILIGNGTGLAGLRALLKARAAAGQGRNWLLFGERSAGHDAFFGAELAAWQTSGLLSRLDLAWSRDPQAPAYVQQRLREQATRLQTWVAEGAALYVCGSAQGMAPAVDALLREQLGTAAVDALIAEGRYRRDVY